MLIAERPGTTVKIIIKIVEWTNTALALSGHNYDGKHLIEYTSIKFPKLPEYRDLMKKLGEADTVDVNTWKKFQKFCIDWMSKKLEAGEYTTVEDLV